MTRTKKAAAVLGLFLFFTIGLSASVGLKTPGDVFSLNIAHAQVDTNYMEDPFRAEPATIADPLEPVNRFFFHFNDKLYFWGLKPVSTVYSWYFPEGVRICVRNGFDNVVAPVRIVNNALQLKFRNAGVELLRFVINSTLGLGGLFDPAEKEFNLTTRDEDLGQTFGHYGLGPGFFLNLPVLGPSSARDAVGRVGDGFLNPTYYFAPGIYEVAGLRGGETVNGTSLRIGEYEDFKASALDPYIAMRDSFLQYRANQIKE
jgi:phospholipid-binding lipoprotein MlaA